MKGLWLVQYDSMDDSIHGYLFCFEGLIGIYVMSLGIICGFEGIFVCMFVNRLWLQVNVSI